MLCMIYQLLALTQYSNCNFLCNTDFEDERLVGNNQFGFFHKDRVSCWETTAADNMIEIWGTGFGGVIPYSGHQFAELNANMVSHLYQEFKMAYNAEVEISFAHRGRAGLDKISVEIGPISGPFVNLGEFSADNTKWVYNTVQFKFPSSGPTTYILRFNSVSAAGGATVGNFLDAISIKLRPPKAFISLVSPTCPNSTNGTILIDSIQGAQPFTYRWSSDTTNRDSFLFNLNKGKYTLTLTDFYGCNELIDINLLSLSSGDSTIINVNSCDAYYWPLNNSNYYTTGTYQHLLKNKFSCDSLITLNLNISKSDTMNIFVEDCKPFSWSLNNLTYSKSGLYFHHLKNINSCDSTILLNLTMNSIDTSRTSVSACDQYSWNQNNLQYTQSGKYYHKLSNINFCDSILELDLKINPSYKIDYSYSECKEFLWGVNKSTYNKSGTYFYNLKSSQGCDSLHTLTLEIRPADSTFLQHTACSEYTWVSTGLNYTQSGNYYASLKNTNSCDSIISLKLNINQPKLTTIREEACKKYNFPFNNETYLKSGQYPFFHLASNGCDSVVLLDLIIHPEQFTVDKVESCDEYYWPLMKETYHQSGTYTKKLQSIHGCDSIFQLDLSINRSRTIYDTIEVFDSYFWPVTADYFTTDTFVVDHQFSSKGCDSILVLILKILKDGQVYVPNVFSPNDDGVNDYFSIYASPEIKIIDRLAIYDRWGSLVFEKNDFAPNIESLGWNGEFKNQKLNPAVFSFYVLYTNNRNQSKVIGGNLTLVR